MDNVEPLLREVPTSTLPVWRIRELSDLFVDALVCDEAGQILFVSVYGRDGAIQQLMSAFHLPTSQGGVDLLTLEPATRPCPHWSRGMRALVGDPKRFGKLTGKLSRGLFGVVSHVFIYDEAAIAADHSAGSGWVISHDCTEEAHQARIWGMVKRLLPLPVLDHWRDALLGAIGNMVVHMDRNAGASWPAIGRVRAAQVRLDNSIKETVSGLVRAGVLTREARSPGLSPSPARPALSA